MWKNLDSYLIPSESKVWPLVHFCFHLKQLLFYYQKSNAFLWLRFFKVVWDRNKFVYNSRNACLFFWCFWLVSTRIEMYLVYMMRRLGVEVEWGGRPNMISRGNSMITLELQFLLFHSIIFICRPLSSWFSCQGGKKAIISLGIEAASHVSIRGKE
jgi:hypothetical protein